MDAALRIQETRLEELARTPGVSVLRYAFDAPAREASAERSLALARDIFKRRADLASLGDDEARARVVVEEEAFGWFRETFPKIFELITQRHGGARHFDVLVELAAVRRQVERGKSQSEAELHVQQLLIDRCAVAKASGTSSSPRPSSERGSRESPPSSPRPRSQACRPEARSCPSVREAPEPCERARAASP